ncbi:HDIG domain-containing protein [candidate division KSB1 bacterium]|nr:HDIG domain-containing protein [candidate division KSB1 bacterium]
MLRFFSKLFNRYLNPLTNSGTIEKRKSKLVIRPGTMLTLLVLGGLFCLLMLSILPRARSFQFSDLRVGDVYIGEEVIAPFDFPINKPAAQLKHDIEAVKTRVYSVFTRNDSIANAQSATLENFLQTIYQLRDSNLEMTRKYESLSHLLKAYHIIISDENLSSLLGNPSNSSSRRHQSVLNFTQALSRQLLKLNQDLFTIGILNVKKSELKYGKDKISIVHQNEERLEAVDFYLDSEAAKHQLKNKIDELGAIKGSAVAAKVSYQILTAFLTPNLIYNATETENRLEQAIRAVPLAKGMVLEAERIIDTHERVTEEHLQKLRSLAEARVERAEVENRLYFLAPLLGKFLFVSIILILFTFYLWLRKTKIVTDLKSLVLIFFIFSVTVVLAFVINNLELSGYLLPIAIAAMLLTTFFDLEVGFIGTVALSILLGALRGNDFNVVIISLLAGSVATVSVNNVRTRSWLLRALLLIISTYILAIFALELLRNTPFRKIFEAIGFGIINGFISPIMAYGLLIILESVFNLTTEMQLLELSDLNKPLLKELAMKAPGTYFHSVVVGNLSETAAEAIGANSLLARVGSYYHDIGKIINPKYFIENQNRGSLNPHEKLSPTMSSLILVNHVRKGVELAQKYKLPEVIRAFITQHHGTNLMNPFYQKALRQFNPKDQQVTEAIFRYPGPRPQTKETGIVMLADAIEAASRSLRDPSVSRIAAMVHAIVHERFIQSELDECPLTLSELNKIGESFQKVLIGIYHARLEYPDQEEKFFRKGRSLERIVNA